MNSFDLFQCQLQGVHLIDASAGTGKTYTITGLLLRLLLEKGLTIEQILVVTYTEAATEELRDKIRTILRQAVEAFEIGSSHIPVIQECIEKNQNRVKALTKLTDALAGFDQAAIFTIHGFCQRILKEYGLETAGLFDTELITDDRDLKEEIAMDFWRSHFYNASFLFVSYAHEKFHREMSSLLNRSFVQQNLKIVPECGELADLNTIVDLEEQYAAFFNTLMQTWSQERENLCRILLESKALNRRSYKKSTVNRWLAAMDGWLGRSVPDVFLFDGFGRLTSSEMKEKLKKGETAPNHPFFEQCDTFAALHKELIGQYNELVLKFKSQFIHYLRDELPDRKTISNVMCFDDLLTGLHDGLTGNGGEDLAKAIRKKFPAAFIDEFQDTDPVQYDIFSKIYGAIKDELLFLIGDPKQAIYSFRGADIFTYIAASREVRNRHTLMMNYRSTTELITAVNTVFSGVSNPFLFEAIPFLPVKPAGCIDDSLLIDDQQTAGMQICWIENLHSEGKPKRLMSKEKAREEILAQTASEIARLLGLGQEGRAMVGTDPVRPVDIAILVRTNREARLASAALASKNVPSVIQGSESIFASREAREMLQLLAGLADPGNTGKVRAALATDILGGEGATLAHLITDENEWINRLIQFRHYNHIWVQHGFMRMFKEVERSLNVRAGLASFCDGERRITNVSHLVEILHHAEMKKKLGMAGLLKFLGRRLAEPDGMEDEYQLRLESDAARVRIVTIHKAKGLQYPIVFCPFCWSGSRISSQGPLSYHQNDEGDVVLDLAPDPNGTGLLCAYREELAEDLRLLYVALTRAQYSCYLFWGAFSGAESSALAYLFHLPSELSQAHVSFKDIADAVREKYKKATDQELLEDMQGLVNRGVGAITCGKLLPSTMPAFLQAQHEEKLELHPFLGNIDSTWKITSFSALTRDRIHAAEIPDRDPYSTYEITEESQLSVVEKSSESDIFSFPGGAVAGNFFHDVLEHIDFQRKDHRIFKKLVTEKLIEYGFDISWHGSVCDALERVLETPLLDNGELVLADVGAAQRIHEMEFYFPLATGGVLAINKFLDKHGLAPALNVLDDRIQSLQPRQGFLKGFVDLIFFWGGKYYLLDWKSNVLGISFENYEKDRLQQVMNQEAYHLQYLLYTIALHQYLERRLPDYRYEDHFGGVFYLFLRGMDPKSKTSSGVFFDFPAPDLIEEFSALIIG